jgi:hypothetical protein
MKKTSKKMSPQQIKRLEKEILEAASLVLRCQQSLEAAKDNYRTLLERFG